MEARTIPAFYCCYLLRSLPGTSSIYLGSTVNPRRRLQQHNTTGGAARTRWAHLRPWTLDCIVFGFPSRIAALQFEWAWHNIHLTRRLPVDDRILAELQPKRRQRNGRKRIVRPRATLSGKLQDLLLLLRVPSFVRWPLKVRFFSEEVWRKWQDQTKTVDIDHRARVNAVLDIKSSEDRSEVVEKPLTAYETGKRRREAIGKGGVDGLDVGYTGIIPHIAKRASILSSGRVIECAVCDKPVDQSAQYSVLCPHEGCTATSHMACLAETFLDCKDSELNLLPTSGHCPKCEKRTPWIDLVTETSLQVRDADKVAQLMKKPGTRKRTVPSMEEMTVPAVELAANGDADAGNEDEEALDEPLPDDWFPQEEEGDDEDDLTSAASTASKPSTPTKSPGKRIRK